MIRIFVTCILTLGVALSSAQAAGWTSTGPNYLQISLISVEVNGRVTVIFDTPHANPDSCGSADRITILPPDAQSPAITDPLVMLTQPRKIRP
mgnify:CR=1 FL=1